jgi:Na+/proline symporter
MAGNVSAFSAVWTYDIYQPLIRKKAPDEHYVAVGRWATILGVVISIGTAYLVMHAAGHHGLCAGAVQLLHLAAAWRGADGHVLEAGHEGGWLLGPADRAR